MFSQAVLLICLPKRLFDYIDLTMTLTFDVTTSEYNQFICVPNCTKVVNLVKFQKAVFKCDVTPAFLMRIFNTR